MNRFVFSYSVFKPNSEKSEKCLQLFANAFTFNNLNNLNFYLKITKQ